MKKLTCLFAFFTFLFTGCSPEELSKEEALQIIRQQAPYPRIVDHDIYASDPQHAKKAMDAGLENKGLVTVQQTQKLGNVGTPLVRFTDKAQPYLVATPEKDKAIDVQKVKLADEDLVEVTAVSTENGGKSAMVEYTTAYQNITPFSALTTIDFTTKATRKARFRLGNEGWQLEKQR
jgi:hypothetical protein